MSMLSTIKSPVFHSLMTVYPLSVVLSTLFPLTDRVYDLHHPGIRMRNSLPSGCSEVTVSLTSPSQG